MSNTEKLQQDINELPEAPKLLQEQELEQAYREASNTASRKSKVKSQKSKVELAALPYLW